MFSSDERYSNYSRLHEKQSPLRERSLPTVTESPFPPPRTRLFKFCGEHPWRFLLFFIYASVGLLYQLRPTAHASFFLSVTNHSHLCPSHNGNGNSISGFIGLDGDTEKTPKRSFFWLFEAQEDPSNAPLILTIGGGPGRSGLLNPLLGQSHCIVKPDGSVVPNPNAWTERYNLLALDHPIGAGFSYGPHSIPNNSRTAAWDVYDFLQKFFTIHPHLLKNQFVIAGGSYGGTYIPHIATVIHNQNLAIRAQSPWSRVLRPRGSVQHKLINLESLMISNPRTDALTHYRWQLYYRCYNTVRNLYNSSTCAELYSHLPQCLESIQFSYENPSALNRLVALEACVKLQSRETDGTMVENISKKCDGQIEDCFPEMAAAYKFLSNPVTKQILGVPPSIPYVPGSKDVLRAFVSSGDLIQPAHLLYEPLLRDGIRLLHYVGDLDANCAWPGVFSFLKRIHSPFQEEFLWYPDLPWPNKTTATVRSVGPGAGNFTYILVGGAGHFRPTSSNEEDHRTLG